ncbi:MAG: hypothetical protein JWP07_4597 [Pseudonocardiales bacterium]|nr:hypothetical protein [Pseudonocardiales bacterium]
MSSAHQTVPPPSMTSAEVPQLTPVQSCGRNNCAAPRRADTRGQISGGRRPDAVIMGEVARSS